MAFIDLECPRKSGGRRCPASAIMVTSRETGTAPNRHRYVAILIGGDVAKQLDLRASPAPIRMSLGSAQDEGKLRIMAHPGGKFVARKQRGGAWLAILPKAALDGRLRDSFEGFLVDRVRFVPSNGQDGPCVIIPMGAAVAPSLRSAA